MSLTNLDEHHQSKLQNAIFDEKIDEFDLPQSVSELSVSELSDQLFHAIEEKPAYVLPVLQYIEVRTLSDKAKILTQVNTYKANPLIWAANFSTEAVVLILDGMRSLPEEQQRQILMQVDEYGRNALMCAAITQHDAVKAILEAMESLSQEDQAEILIQCDCIKTNVVMLANEGSEQNLPYITEAIIRSHPKHPEKYFDLLNDNNGLSKESILTIIKYYPEAKKGFYSCFFSPRRAPTYHNDAVRLAEDVTCLFDEDTNLTRVKERIREEIINVFISNPSFKNPYISCLTFIALNLEEHLPLDFSTENSLGRGSYG